MKTQLISPIRCFSNADQEQQELAYKDNEKSGEN